MKPLLITLFIFITASVFAQTTQQSIDKAMGESFASESNQPLVENFDNLESTYWKAYNLYLQSVYNMKTGKDYEDIVKSGIELLQPVESKNSEEYALLATLVSMKMSYLTQIGDLMQADNSFNTYVEQAIKLDPTNPRAYYVAGLYDYNKPSIYGGGTQAEKLLSKALELYGSYDGDITWGQNYAQETYDQIQSKK